MHNKVAIKSLRFVLNREILRFGPTFLESTQKFAKKCPLYRGRGCTRLARNHFSVWKELKVWQNRKISVEGNAEEMQFTKNLQSDTCFSFENCTL